MEQALNKRKSVWPNFFIIGAAKAGTTSLYYYLKQHNELFMPKIKEPNFFALYQEKISHLMETKKKYSKCSTNIYYRIKENSITNLNEYLNLFCEAFESKARGEASTLYLLHPKAPERIHNLIPNAKIIAILRNPIERSFSSYVHLLSEGFEKRTFRQALLDEPYKNENIWLSNGPYYIRPGFYFNGLTRFYKYFSKNRIRIYLYDNFKEDPYHVISDIYNFLGIETNFRPDLKTKYNVSGIPKSKYHQIILNNIKTVVFNKFLAKIYSNSSYYYKHKHKLNKFKSRFFLKSMKVYSEEREFLRKVYEKDIFNLENLIERDLSIWMR